MHIAGSADYPGAALRMPESISSKLEEVIEAIKEPRVVGSQRELIPEKISESSELEKELIEAIKGPALFIPENSFEDFITATIANRIDEVKRILQLHPEYLNEKDRLGRTALHWAASEGFSNIVEFLLGNNSINLDIKAAGNTPFMDAVQNNKKEVIMLFYGSGKLSSADVREALEDYRLFGRDREIYKMLETFLRPPFNQKLIESSH